MPQGVIKRIVADRGFGFISGDRGRGDIFFHHSSVANEGFDDLKEGQAIAYELEGDEGGRQRGKGPRASSVTPV